MILCCDAILIRHGLKMLIENGDLYNSLNNKDVS